MLQEETTGRPEVSPPESTQLPSAPMNPDVDAIQRMEGGSGLGWRAQLAVPLAALVALAIHLLFSKSAPAIETHSYTLFICEIVAVSIVLAIAQRFWTPLRILDAAHVPDLYGGNLVSRYLGRDYIRFPTAPDAVFSRPSSGPAQSN